MARADLTTVHHHPLGDLQSQAVRRDVVRGQAAADLVGHRGPTRTAGGRHVQADRQLVRRSRRTGCHAASCRHTWLITQEPIGSVRPVSSATGRNWPAAAARGSGASSGPAPRRRRVAAWPGRRSAGSAVRARRGRWRRRSSASVAAGRPPRRAWPRRRRVAALAAASRGTSRCRRRAAGPRRSWPPWLDGDADAGRHDHLLPRRNGWLGDAAGSRSAIEARSAASAMSSRRIANSSPPKPGRRVAVATQRPRSARRPAPSSWSPAGVPEAVVDHLEAVEVEEQHGERGSRGGARRAPAPLDAVQEQRPVGQAGQRVVRARPGAAAPRAPAATPAPPPGPAPRRAARPTGSSSPGRWSAGCRSARRRRARPSPWRASSPAPGRRSRPRRGRPRAAAPWVGSRSRRRG